MSDRFESREKLAGKIEWEGGLLEALDYGIKTADMPDPESDPDSGELIEAWTKLEESFRQTDTLAEAVRKLLPDDFCEEI